MSSVQQSGTGKKYIDLYSGGEIQVLLFMQYRESQTAQCHDHANQGKRDKKIGASALKQRAKARSPPVEASMASSKSGSASSDLPR